MPLAQKVCLGFPSPENTRSKRKIDIDPPEILLLHYAILLLPETLWGSEFSLQVPGLFFLCAARGRGKMGNGAILLSSIMLRHRRKPWRKANNARIG